MKRFILIIVVGVGLCLAAYAAVYLLGTAPVRSLAREKVPELAWLKKEFQLTDTEFNRVAELHAAYQPHCMEMCSLIAAKEAEIRDLMTKTDHVTPEIGKKFTEAAQLRAECQTAMLQHFYTVSQTMPPTEGKRYLAWVEENSSLLHNGMAQSH